MAEPKRESGVAASALSQERRPQLSQLLLKRENLTSWPIIKGAGFDVYLSKGHLLVGLAIVAIGALLWWVTMRTSFGRNQRACAQDLHMAALLGVNVDLPIAHIYGFSASGAAFTSGRPTLRIASKKSCGLPHSELMKIAVTLTAIATIAHTVCPPRRGRDPAMLLPERFHTTKTQCRPP